MSARSEQMLAEIIRESTQRHPLPATVAELDKQSQRVIGERAARAGVTAEAYLALARANEAATVSNHEDLDAVVAAVRGR